MSVDTIVDEAKSLPSDQLKSLVLDLAALMDGESCSELTSVLDTRRRAAEMKAGSVSGLSHDEAFARARRALKN